MRIPIPCVLLAVPVLGGCLARTVNLVQPDGPRFEGRYAGRGESRPVPPALRVVTFNLKFGREVDRAIDVLRSPELAEADVIAMQEMDERGTESIARALGLDYAYFPAVIHPIDGRYFGPALLSRWPIDSAWKVLLPHVGGVRHQRRTATGAVINVAGARVRIYSIHLEPQTRLSPSEHIDQAAAVVAEAAGATGPVILAGDFNGSEVGRYLSARGFRWPTSRIGATSFLFALDHIFVRGTPAAPTGAGVVRDVRGASDHRPVWAEIPLEAPAAR